MEKINFAQAIDRFYSMINAEDVADYSSITINFFEEWAGAEHCYVIDTMTDEVAPRLYSLDTAKLIDGFTLPEKQEDVKLDELTKSVAAEFKAAYDAMQVEIAETTGEVIE